MPLVIYSLSNSTLKLSSVHDGQVLTASQELADQDPNELQNIHQELIKTVCPAGTKKCELVFITEPSDVYLNFVVVNKSGGDIVEQITTAVKEKLTDINIDDVYFGYQKLAPFVYQTIAIQKTKLEGYLDIANMLGMPIKAVFPWVMLLPRLVGSAEPMIFVSKDAHKQVVALGELGGLFYVGSYDHEKTNAELQKLVAELSVYKRSDNPITKVYTFNYQNFNIDDQYELTNLDLPSLEDEAYVGFEKHALVRDAYTKQPELDEAYINLLNLLPVPEVKKPSPAVYAGVAAGLLLVVVSAFFGLRGLGGADNASDNVLSEQVVVEEPAVEEPVVVELNKKDLKIRVENGSEIAGKAGETEAYLTDLGYTVVSIGDASVSGNTATFVKFKPDKSQYQELLETDLTGKVEAVFSQDVPADAEYDVLIVLGTELNL